MDDALIAGTCAVGVTMKAKLANSTSNKDEDEIASYCLTALRDFTGIIGRQMGGMVGTWVRGETPHETPYSPHPPPSPPSPPPMRVVYDYEPVVKSWNATALAAAQVRTRSGQHTACRHEHMEDTSPHYFRAHGGVRAIEDCMRMCSNNGACKGIEYNAALARCEVWFRDLNSVAPADNFVCLRRIERRVYG